DLIEKAYDIFNKDGVQRVYHAGDMCSGDSVYRGQQYETLYPGFQAQKKAVIDNYPQLKDGKTFFILGNHDYSFIKKSNSNLGLDIPDKRKDLNYVGEIVADVQISGSDPLDDATAEDNRAPGTTLRLFHPTGGLAYALSYKPQRYVDNLPSDGRKPNILVIGHYHTRCSFDRRNIKVYQVPCFEEESPYLIEKGLQPTIGFSWLDIQLSREGSIVGMMVKEYTYYAGVGFTSGFGPEED
ncbi:MAG: metallophosphoesterase, partial [Firmicutes bacterium]|nr:metallophosphoesterase [Bacillota bacterium]